MQAKSHSSLSLYRFLILSGTCILLVLQQVSSSELPGEIPESQRSLAGSDGFDAFDADHNGQIDHKEYNSGLSKLQNALSGELGISSGSGENSSATGGGVSNLLNLSQFTSPSNSSKSELKFWPAFVNSLSMIIATEIGDKTFFIAAVLSMKNDRIAVFTGAILALIVMTILSSMMGLVLPSFLPRKYTHIIGGILFLYFGIKLVNESRSMSEGKCSDELEEVEEELLQQSSKKDDLNIEDSLEVGLSNKGDNVSPSKSKRARKDSSAKKSKIFVQALSMTFLAEWGDRSQIATIALAAAKDPIGVNVGGILGHTICTGMAVLGGRMLAAKIEEKTVTKWSGIIFLLFGIHSLFFEES